MLSNHCCRRLCRMKYLVISHGGHDAVCDAVMQQLPDFWTTEHAEGRINYMQKADICVYNY
jgi:hypothetical protein